MNSRELTVIDTLTSIGRIYEKVNYYKSLGGRLLKILYLQIWRLFKGALFREVRLLYVFFFN